MWVSCFHQDNVLLLILEPSRSIPPVCRKSPPNRYQTNLNNPDLFPKKRKSYPPFNFRELPTAPHQSPSTMKNFHLAGNSFTSTNVVVNLLRPMVKTHKKRYFRSARKSIFAFWFWAFKNTKAGDPIAIYSQILATVVDLGCFNTKDVSRWIVTVASEDVDDDPRNFTIK